MQSPISNRQIYEKIVPDKLIGTFAWLMEVKAEDRPALVDSEREYLGEA